MSKRDKQMMEQLDTPASVLHEATASSKECNEEKEDDIRTNKEESKELDPDVQSAIDRLYEEYSIEGIHNFARELGIDPDTEPELLWIVKECLDSPLPDGFVQWPDRSGKIFYTHFSAGNIPLNHPMLDDFCQLVTQTRGDTVQCEDTAEEKQEPFETSDSEDLTFESEEESKVDAPFFTDEGIHFFAQFLYVNPDTEPELLWMVKEYYEAPLPAGWKEGEDSSDETIYRNTLTGEITQDDPTPTYYRQTVIAVRKGTWLKTEDTETSELRKEEEKQEPLETSDNKDLTCEDEEEEEEEEENMLNLEEEAQSEEESNDDSLNLTDEGIHFFAQFLGIDPDTEPELLWMVKEYYEAPLPAGWEEGALQQRLLSERSEEEARLNEESDRMLKELMESVQQQRERQQLQVREDSEVFLKEQHVTLEKEEAAERHKLEAQKNQNVERLRADMEEELQAERKKLQEEMEEELGSLKRELTNSHQEMKEEMQRDHKTKMKQLWEDHEREMHSIRQQCLDEAELLRKNLVTHHQEDIKHLQDSCAAQLEKLHLELNAQVHKAQKIQSQKASELQDLADQIELKAKDLKIQDTMLQTKLSDLERKRKKLEEEEGRVDKRIEAAHMHEKTDVSTPVCLCQALTQLLLKQTNEATVVERLREETHKTVAQNKRLEGKDKRLKKEREEALKESKRAKMEEERQREERDKALEKRRGATVEEQLLRDERDKAIEESRRAKMDKKFLENKVLLLEERCDLLSQIIRPQPERDINKVPSCHKRDSPPHMEDLFRPPLSPEPPAVTRCVSE